MSSSSISIIPSQHYMPEIKIRYQGRNTNKTLETIRSSATVFPNSTECERTLSITSGFQTVKISFESKNWLILS